MIRLAKPTFLALAVMTWSTTASETLAQSVAYHGHGTGVYSPITGDYSGEGVATHLGAHTFSSNVATSPTADPLVVDWHSTIPQETIAANGDKLFFTASGQVRLIPLDISFTTFSAVWTGDFVVVGGTGRFANAKPAAEPLRVTAVNDPFTFLETEWTFEWELRGRIQLR